MSSDELEHKPQLDAAQQPQLKVADSDPDGTVSVNPKITVADEETAAESTQLPAAPAGNEIEPKASGADESDDGSSDTDRVLRFLEVISKPISLMISLLYKTCLYGLIAFVFTVILSLVFSRQIVDFADHELNKNQYTAVPLKAMIDPLYDGSKKDKDEYWKGIMRSYGAICRNTYTPEMLDTLRMLSASKYGAPLHAYMNLANNDSCVRLGWRAQSQPWKDASAARHIQSSVDELTHLTNSNNIAVGHAERTLAQYYLNRNDLEQAERHVRKALEIDRFGRELGVFFAQQDRLLLAAIEQRDPDTKKKDQAWSEYLDVSRERNGKNSLTYAAGLVSHAKYLCNSGRLADSLVDAQSSFLIVKNHQDGFVVDGNGIQVRLPDGIHFKLFGLVPVFGSTSLAKSPVFSEWLDYFSAIHKQAAASPDANLRQAVYALEDEYVSWFMQQRSFDKLRGELRERLADEWRLGGDYTRARKLYFQALKDGADPTKRFGRKPGGRLSAQRKVSSEYVLLMAKTAHNAFLKGDTQEGLTILGNVMQIVDPMASWRSFDDYSEVLDELVYTMGPLSKENKSGEVKKVADSLVSFLQAKDFRGSNERPTQGSAMLLGKFFELQGNLSEAEKYYRAAADRNRNSSSYGTLAVFLDKQGKFLDAGQLYQKSEQAFRAEYHQPLEGYAVVVNQGHLKRLLESTTDYSFINDPRLNCFVGELELIKKARTSHDIGRCFSILDPRPIVRDFRVVISPPNSSTTNSPGFIYVVRSARKDLQSLSEANRKLAAQRFKWFQVCLPSPPTNYPFRELLPGERLPGIVSGPKSLRALKPEEVLIIDAHDKEDLAKMLGRPLTLGTKIEIAANDQLSSSSRFTSSTTESPFDRSWRSGPLPHRYRPRSADSQSTDK